MKSIIFIIAYTFHLLLFSGCQNVRMLTPQEIYRKEFLAQINEASHAFSRGNLARAESILEDLDDAVLKDQEKAKKYNLVGIIAFARSNYLEAKSWFEFSLPRSNVDRQLSALIRLNLASVHFQLSEYKESEDYLSQVETKALNTAEKKKFYKLNFVIADRMDNKKEMLNSLVYLLENVKNAEQFESTEYSSALVEAFNSLAPSERAYFLQKYEDKNLYVVGHLAKQEVLTRFYSGDKSSAKDVLNWISKYFSSNVELSEFVKEFSGRMKNYSKLDQQSIGILLPLSGEKGNYGEKALKGMEVILHGQSKDVNLKAHIRDHKNNPLVAKKLVEELVRTKHVSMIIGGLFPATAKEEYLEAKKYGVLYLSLSPIFLEREQKDHLLVEISGSVQSQIERIFSDDFLTQFGRKIAIFYPDSPRGQVYLDEIWSRYQQKNVQITSLQAFDDNISDFRKPVQKLLGLYFTRERKEEYDLLSEIHALKKKGAIRRIQTLPPVVDFDWVFIPSHPQEAVQVLPVFNYYDANRVLFVGGPSWMSRKLIKEGRNFSGKMLMVGDDPADFKGTPLSLYQQRYGHSPHLIETLGSEALYLAEHLIKSSNANSREDFEKAVLSNGVLSGMTGSWKLSDRIWIKEMDVLKIGRKSISKIELISNSGNSDSN